MKFINRDVIANTFNAICIIMDWPRYFVAVIMIMLSIVFWSARGAPLEIIVQHTLKIFEYIGLMVAMLPLWLGSVSYPSYDPTVSLYDKVKFIIDQVKRLLSGLFVYFATLWFVSVHGDSVYVNVVANPEVSIASAVASVLAWITASIVLRKRHDLIHATAFSGSAKGVMNGTLGRATFIKRQITERDSRYIAAHEAAHALIYSALGALPSGFKVVINDDPEGHSPLGYVTRVQLDHQLSEKEFAEWDMLVLLAGKIGEETLHDGKATLGSGNDNAHWLCIASSYLSNHYGGFFYNPPQSKVEADQNEEKLLTLKTHQVELLRLFFQMNADVFKSLTDTLLAKRTLLGDDVENFFRQVKFPDKFAFPFGKFHEFGERAIPDLTQN